MMYDAIVVGAGPAGSVAALEAARYGFKVLLLERERLPRYKLCGGAISKKTLKLLEARKILGRTDLGRIAEGVITGVKLATPRCTRSFNANEMLSIMTYRDKFDYFLTQQAMNAGAEVKDGVKVLGVITKDDDCVVRVDGGEYTARYVFGADGIKGPVRRDSGLIPGFPRDQVAIAGEFELDDYGGYDADSQTMEFHFGIVPFGYGWVFPKGNSLSVGVGCLASELGGRSLKEKLYEFAGSLGLTDLPRPGFHLIPFGGFERRMASDKVLLCGDAAGLVDTTAGEGTYYSIRSGLLAAETLRGAQEDGEKSLLSYQKKCEEEIIPDLRGSLKLGKWLYAHLELFYYMVDKEPGIMKVFPEIAKLDEPFEKIFRHVMLLGAKNYIKRRLGF